MIVKETGMLGRREFLRGAAILAVGAGIGINSQARRADRTTGDYPSSASPEPLRTSLSLWSQGQLINPAALASGSPALTTAIVKVKIHGHFVPSGAAPLLHVIKAHFAIPNDYGVSDAPVYAWVTGGKDTMIRIPVAPGRGVMLSAELNAPASAEDFYFLVSGSGSGKPKLTTGTYVLAVGLPSLAGVRLQETPSASVLTYSTGPVPFEYVLITVA